MKIEDMMLSLFSDISSDDIAALTEVPSTSNPAALVPDGAEFDFAGIRFIRLGEEQGGILCVTKGTIGETVFNNDWKDNDYSHSEIREYVLREFAGMLPREELLSYTMNLKSFQDPTVGWGYCADIAGILTEELYKKYRRFIPTGSMEWLCTPYSVSMESPWVLYVYTSGSVNNYYAYNALRCRPACIFRK